uniref:Transmembrane protein 65 n=1 Tax=Cyanistes caeruleus TaxID=156563 RepID=A0A8C0UKB0_CYACU
MAEAAGKPILCCSCYAEGRSSEKLEVAPPSPGQLRHVFFHNALPFVGFGFLDNAIMIAAGTQIELSIGVVLGISTMAAAALGNLVSDLAGLGLAGYVEALASRLGLSIPDLTPKQADMWQTRLSAHLGVYNPDILLGGIPRIHPLPISSPVSKQIYSVKEQLEQHWK